MLVTGEDLWAMVTLAVVVGIMVVAAMLFI